MAKGEGDVKYTSEGGVDSIYKCYIMDCLRTEHENTLIIQKSICCLLLQTPL